MTLLDAYALIATFAGEPAAADVRPILREGNAKVAATNLAETYDRLVRILEVPIADVDALIYGLKRARRVFVTAIDEPLARRAGELRSIYYRRNDRPVSLADCVAAATAESLSEALATPDPGLASMARAIGIDVIALPDSSGTRP